MRDLLLTAPDAAVAAFAADRERLRNPAMGQVEYIEGLRRAGLNETAAVLEAFADRL
jgi:hypothetical protein